MRLRSEVSVLEARLSILKKAPMGRSPRLPWDEIPPSNRSRIYFPMGAPINIQHGNNNLLSLHLLINNVYYPLLLDKPSPLSSTTIVMSSVSFDPAAGVENLRVQQNLCLVKTRHAASTFSLFGNWSAVSRHDQMLRLWLWRDVWWQPFLYATLWYHVCAPCSIANVNDKRESELWAVAPKCYLCNKHFDFCNTRCSSSCIDRNNRIYTVDSLSWS